MNIEGNGYKVSYDQGILTMAGKLSVMPEEYEEIEILFENILKSVKEANLTELILDLRKLEFLNSSGIKTICVGLVMEADDIEDLHLKILCTNAFTWQRETIPTFEDLMDNMEIVFES